MTTEKTPSSTSVDSIVLPPCPGPQPDEAKSGWDVSFSFLKSLSDAAEEAEGSMVTMEAVEAIILALRDRGHVRISDGLNVKPELSEWNERAIGKSPRDRCVMCNGEGRVYLRTGASIDCMVCDGSGY